MLHTYLGISPRSTFRPLDNAKRIGDLFVKLLNYEWTKNDKPFGADYLRVKVNIVVKEPLLSGFSMEGEHSSKRWIWFRYERLSNYTIIMAD